MGCLLMTSNPTLIFLTQKNSSKLRCRTGTQECTTARYKLISVGVAYCAIRKLAPAARTLRRIPMGKATEARDVPLAGMTLGRISPSRSTNSKPPCRVDRQYIGTRSSIKTSTLQSLKKKKPVGADASGSPPAGGHMTWCRARVKASSGSAALSHLAVVSPRALAEKQVCIQSSTRHTIQGLYVNVIGINNAMSVATCSIRATVSSSLCWSRRVWR
ncbi:hypothetical protein C8F01DRAFT_1122467 [Mycena amicta]|nr:hypothetical protein C8F01DRAFT_1122467 [Mycena amicta]